MHRTSHICVRHHNCANVHKIILALLSMLYFLIAAILVLILYIHMQQCQSRKETFEDAKYPDFVGKQLSIVSATSPIASTTSVIVLHVNNGTIAKPPIVLIPRASKFVGKPLATVFPILQKRYGDKHVIAEPVSLPQNSTHDVSKKIIIQIDSSNIVRNVLIPKQWLQPNEMPVRKQLDALVGTRPVVTQDGQSVAMNDKDPKRLRLFVKNGVVSRVPYLG